MPCVKRCCCCVTLRMGGITMGVMTLALSVFSIIPMAISLAHRVFLSQVVTHVVRKYSGKDDEGNQLPEQAAAKAEEPVALWGTVSSAFANDGRNLPPQDDEKVVWLAGVMLVFFIVAIILLLVYLVCSILLIYGAVKGRRWCLLPWIVATFLVLLAYLGGVIVSIWLFDGRLEILLLLAIAIIETAIGFYLWTCIVSLFQVLGSDDFRRAGNNDGDWQLKPRFSTTYNSVPNSDKY